MILIWVIWGSTTWSQLRVHIPEGFLVFILFGFPGIVVLKPADQCSSGSVAEGDSVQIHPVNQEDWNLSQGKSLHTYSISNLQGSDRSIDP